MSKPTVPPSVLPHPDPLVWPEPGQVGVAYVPPPPSLLPEIQRQVELATAHLEPGTAALVGVADRKGGWNASIGAKTKNGWSADAWIGKSWGADQQLDWGVRVLKTWTLGG